MFLLLFACVMMKATCFSEDYIEMDAFQYKHRFGDLVLLPMLLRVYHYLCVINRYIGYLLILEGFL